MSKEQNVDERVHVGVTRLATGIIHVLLVPENNPQVPHDVAEAWVGLNLPLSAVEDDCYLVEQTAALGILRQNHSEVAAWWEKNIKIAKGHHFCFSTGDVEVVGRITFHNPKTTLAEGLLEVGVGGHDYFAR